MKLKSILLAGIIMLVGLDYANAGPSSRNILILTSNMGARSADIMVTEKGYELASMFNQDDRKLLDWAIASSVEVAFYYGNGGRKGIGGQVPIIFLDRGIVSGDLGYVSITEASPNDLKVGNLGQASLAPGVSIRINRILEVYFPKASDSIKYFNETTYELWDRFFFGPAYSYITETQEHIGWFKCGVKIF